ncbi:uncharacterized protein LOC110050965 [Orbicella faveolata]|uniref:uncharacterized protein LOC110050965 n=1 Tax=Orbicella faveolata TaxID=48498 RepID=UPI0009E5DE21|nr:uncharacterized protein LOC110050965 [Orbicella faveolata]
MDNSRERKTSGESTASDSSETVSCRPYYLPESPAAGSSSQVVRSACSSSVSSSRVGDYLRSPAGGMSDKSREEKRRLSPSWSTTDPKQAKFTHGGRTGYFTCILYVLSIYIQQS